MKNSREIMTFGKYVRVLLPKMNILLGKPRIWTEEEITQEIQDAQDRVGYDFDDEGKEKYQEALRGISENYQWCKKNNVDIEAAFYSENCFTEFKKLEAQIIKDKGGVMPYRLIMLALWSVGNRSNMTRI